MNEHRQQTCRHCGRKHKFDKKENCPTYGKASNECEKKNHFAECCYYQRHRGYNKKDRHPYGKQDSTPRRIKRVETESDKSSEDEESIRKMTDEIKIHKIKTIKQKHYNIKEVRIGHIDPFCEPDTGVSANIMDEYQFKALKRRTKIRELKPNYDRVKTIQGELSYIT